MIAVFDMIDQKPKIKTGTLELSLLDKGVLELSTVNRDLVSKSTINFRDYSNYFKDNSSSKLLAQYLFVASLYQCCGKIQDVWVEISSNKTLLESFLSLLNHSVKTTLGVVTINVEDILSVIKVTDVEQINTKSILHSSLVNFNFELFEFGHKSNSVYLRRLSDNCILEINLYNIISQIKNEYLKSEVMVKVGHTLLLAKLGVVPIDYGTRGLGKFINVDIKFRRK